MKTSNKVKKVTTLISDGDFDNALKLLDEIKEEVKIFEKIKFIFTGSNRIPKERKYEDT
jgi:hypothetical protein